jgi:hypothetical protein
LRRIAVLLLLVLSMGGSAPAPTRAATGAIALAARATVVSLRTDASDHEVFASFVVRGAFDDDVRERLAAGLPLEFVHHVEVARRRVLWFDKVVVRKTITTSVTYDTLTRQYSLSKKVNDEVAETSVAMHEAEAERWMTQIERVRLADSAQIGSESDGQLYLRVRSVLRKRFVLLFVPWDVETGWEKVVLNLPGEAAIRAR